MCIIWHAFEPVARIIYYDNYYYSTEFRYGKNNAYNKTCVHTYRFTRPVVIRYSRLVRARNQTRSEDDVSLQIVIISNGRALSHKAN